MNQIGIMQGRLSPPSGGKIQSFPVNTWREEFTLAKQAGLDCIEWVYEEETEPVNPLCNNTGVNEIKKMVTNSGIAVWSICADYYMTQRLVALDGTPAEAVVRHLEWLVRQADLLGVQYIVLPFVDESSLSSPGEVEGMLSVLRAVIPVAERTGIELHLETDLTPAGLLKALNNISHPLVRANYDIGNSAALGHDTNELIKTLGAWIGSVHVKDRLRNGGTVPLGSGVANLPASFRLLQVEGYNGPFILQTARQENISEVELAIRNRQYIEEQLLYTAKLES